MKKVQMKEGKNDERKIKKKAKRYEGIRERRVKERKEGKREIIK